jgi:polar amino acid transport system substrate-binding protein
MNAKKRGMTLRLLSILAVLALVVAACGTDDGDGGGDGTTPGDGTDTTAPADGGGDLAELFPDGSVTIGIANEIPYGYEDESGEATGEAPEVAKAILAELGITEVDATVVDFGSLIPGLQAGEYDMIAAGMFITAERAQEIIFSDPDYCGATAFAVPEGNPDGLTDFQSVVDAGIDLGVLSGAVEEGYALDSGVPDGNVIRFGETAQAFDALAGGRIDAVALTDVTVATQVAGLEGFESSEPFIPVVNGEEQLGCGGFGFVEQEFRDIFNAKLKEFQDEGQILPLVEEFGFSEASVEKAAELTVEDLTG